MRQGFGFALGAMLAVFVVIVFLVAVAWADAQDSVLYSLGYNLRYEPNTERAPLALRIPLGQIIDNDNIECGIAGQPVNGDDEWCRITIIAYVHSSGVSDTPPRIAAAPATASGTTAHNQTGSTGDSPATQPTTHGLRSDGKPRVCDGYNHCIHVCRPKDGVTTIWRSAIMGLPFHKTHWQENCTPATSEMLTDPCGGGGVADTKWVSGLADASGLWVRIRCPS